MPLNVSGPLFDGRAEAEMTRYAAAVSDALSTAGVNMVQSRLGQVLQDNQGHYQSAIHTDRQVSDMVVTDTPVVYGPWLEGVGSRNSATRFKGYHTFRAVSQELDRTAVPAAEAILDKGFIEAVN